MFKVDLEKKGWTDKTKVSPRSLLSFHFRKNDFSSTCNSLPRPPCFKPVCMLRGAPQSRDLTSLGIPTKALWFLFWLLNCPNNHPAHKAEDQKQINLESRSKNPSYTAKFEVRACQLIHLSFVEEATTTLVLSLILQTFFGQRMF